jgi:hypothetical protein
MENRNPYAGPRPLGAEDPIFGREREIRELLYLFTAERIVLLVSPSGAGKSSLINAQNGLLDQMRRRFDVWTPTRLNLPPWEPVDNRFAWSAAVGFEQEVPADRRRTPEALARLTLKEAVATRARKQKAPKTIVLVFDQFEEVLRVDPLHVEEKREFFRQAGELLQDPQIWALFVLREDYLAPLDPYSRLLPTHLQNRYRIDLLQREAAKEAVVKTAISGGREFTGAAADKLVHDLSLMKVQQADGSFAVEEGPYVEPLQLQVACRGLWERMPEDDLRIDPEDVEQFGNVTEALSLYYAGQVAKIAGGDVRAERVIRDWVGHKLITANGVRGQVMRGQRSSDGLSNDVIASLVNAHMVRAEQRGGAVWYELAHDRLIAPVREDNARWVDEHLSPLQRQADLWNRQGRPESLLAGEELKRQAAELIEAGGLTDVERTFLEASETKLRAMEKERRQSRRLRRLTSVSVLVSLIALLLLLVTCGSLDRAERAEADAELLHDTLVKESIATTWTSAIYLVGQKETRFQASTNVVGVRDLYNTMQYLMNLEKMEYLSPVPIFKQGPHRKTFDTKSAQFGHYNPDFLAWAEKELIPAAEDEYLRKLTQPVYDEYLKEIARTYYIAHNHVQASKCTAEALALYQELLIEFENKPFDSDAGDGPGYPLQKKFWPLFFRIDARRYDWNEGNAPHYVVAGAAFWVRRRIDKTEQQFHKLLVKLLVTYDRAWLEGPEAQETLADIECGEVEP